MYLEMLSRLYRFQDYNFSRGYFFLGLLNIPEIATFRDILFLIFFSFSSSRENSRSGLTYTCAASTYAAQLRGRPGAFVPHRRRVAPVHLRASEPRAADSLNAAPMCFSLSRVRRVLPRASVIVASSSSSVRAACGCDILYCAGGAPRRDAGTSRQAGRTSGAERRDRASPDWRREEVRA